MERVGLRALENGARAWPPPTTPVSELDASERRALRDIERYAVLRAGIAGALSAGVTALVATRVLELEQSDVTRYWLWVGGAGALTSVVEVGYLYWDSLRAVRLMAKASGVALYAGETLDRGVALSLARAALELPSPGSNPLGVDPHREARRWQLIAASVLYKAKVALSTFLLKALLRRVFGRLAARAALEFVAVPVTAVWNMVVCDRVLREARIRAMGPSLAKELARWIVGSTTSPGGSPETSRLVAWALGTSIVKNRRVHPNWVALITHLDLPGQLEGDFGDCPRFLAAFKTASQSSQRAALRALVSAALLDGRFSRLERQWIEVVFTMAGLTPPLAEVARACGAFVAGDGFDPTPFRI